MNYKLCDAIYSVRLFHKVLKGKFVREWMTVSLYDFEIPSLFSVILSTSSRLISEWINM